MNKVTFSQYIADYQVVSVQNEDLLDELGCLNAYNDEEYENKTTFLIVFKNGGFIQCLADGRFYLELDRCEWTSNDWKTLAPHLYEWCIGEYFESQKEEES